MDGVEVEAHQHHRTGHSVFDFIVSGSAVLISCVSLFIAVQHGRTMEKLVEANSFPNIELSGGLAYTSKPDELALGLDLENTGVGPGRIETIELWENGKPIGSASELVDTIKSAEGGNHTKVDLEGGTVLESLLGAGKTKTIIRLKFAGVQHWFPPLSKILFGLESRICYCSVFDECHVSDSREDKGRPKSVQQCPKPPLPYDDNFKTFVSDGVAKGQGQSDGPPPDAQSKESQTSK